MQDEIKWFVQKEEQEVSLFLFPFLLFSRDKPYKSYVGVG